MKNNIKLAVMLFALAVAPAMAQTYYIGGSVGQADHDQNRADWAPAGSVTSFRDIDFGYKLFGGYKFNRFVSVEGGYTNLGRYTANLSTAGDAGTARVRTDSWNVFGVGTVELVPNFSLFGKLGVSYNKSRMDFSSNGVVYRASDSGSDSKTAFAFGVGGAYAFSKSFSARIEYEDFGNAGETNNGFTTAGKTSNSKPRLMSTGLQYSF